MLGAHGNFNLFTVISANRQFQRQLKFEYIADFEMKPEYIGVFMIGL